MSQPQPVFPVSEVTKTVLDNFSKIAAQVLLQAGCTQRVSGPGKAKTMFAVATFPEAWPKKTPIYNFDKFLGTLSLFDSPAIQFNSDNLTVTSASRSAQMKVKLHMADASTIEDLSAANLPNDNPAVEITLSKYALDRLLKTTSLLNLSHFTINVDADKVSIKAAAVKNPLSDLFELDITDVVRHDAKFTRSMRFPVSHFQLVLGGDYTIALSKWSYAYLTNKTLPVTYFIAEDR